MRDSTRLPEPLRVTRRAMIATSVRACAVALVAVASGGVLTASASELAGRPQDHPHPEPRPGVDASRILPEAKVREHPDAVAAFEDARRIPQILDGIRCHCGCASEPGMRSLLTCYEGDGMALECRVCQGQARLAYRLHKRGRSLAQIRESIDARYGS